MNPLRTQHSLSELAQRFKLELVGEGDTQIKMVATLQSAQNGQLTFLANPQYRSQLLTTQASAVVLHPDEAHNSPCAALISKNPYASFAKIAALFEQQPARAAGIHPSAVVDPSASIAPTAHIGPHCSVGARATIAAGAVIGAASVIGDDCHIGEQTVLIARVTLVANVRVGKRVRIHAGAVLGTDGFGLAMDQGAWLKVPQLGGVIIGDDCEIGANTCIDRGALGDTVLHEDVRLDNLIQIGHNVQIGAHTAMAGCSAAAGSAKIGEYCLIGGGAGILGHLEITDRVTIHAMSLVSHSIRKSGQYSSGTPLQENRAWRRNAVRFKQLDELAKIIRTSKQDRDND